MEPALLLFVSRLGCGCSIVCWSLGISWNSQQINTYPLCVKELQGNKDGLPYYSLLEKKYRLLWLYLKNLIWRLKMQESTLCHPSLSWWITPCLELWGISRTNGKGMNGTAFNGTWKGPKWRYFDYEFVSILFANTISKTRIAKLEGEKRGLQLLLESHAKQISILESCIKAGR